MRSVILMPDWNAILFWWDNESRCSIDEESLPISGALKHDLRLYYEWFSELYFRGVAGAPVSLIDRRLLDARGLSLWRRLRAELGAAFQVHFYSQEFHQEFAHPEDLAMLQQA